MINLVAIGIALLILFWCRQFDVSTGRRRFLKRTARRLRGSSKVVEIPMAFARLGLLDLPDEILIAIVSNVNLEGLYNVRLTSKHLRELAEPLIFEKFDVLHGSDARYLISCITADRRRAKWLKSLLVSTRYGEDQGLEDLPLHLAEMRNMRSLRLETPDCNTKKPDDRIDWVNLQKGYERILANSTVAIPPEERLLPRLQSCTIHFVDETKALYPLTKYSSVFLHPTLKSLTLSCACTDLPSELLVPYQKAYRRSTNLEHLHLEECDIYSASLYILLSFPKALKSLTISEGTRYDRGFGPHQSRMHGNALPNFLADAITRTSRDSLQRLSLDLGFKRGPGNINTEGRFLDLTHLDRVTYLELSSETAENMVISRPVCDHQTWRRLPPNLEVFKISHLNAYCFPPFRRGPNLPSEDCLIKNKISHGVPKLRHLIWSYQHHSLEGPLRLQGLVRRFHGEETTRPQQIKSTKTYLAGFCNRNLPLYKSSGIRMQIEFVVTPEDFIPPFLYPEPKPTSNIFWDSDTPPIEARAALSSARERYGQPESNVFMAESSDSSFSDFDSDSDIEIALTGLPPQAQALMAMLMQNATP